jgi:hypothetical protein
MIGHDLHPVDAKNMQGQQQPPYDADLLRVVTTVA